MEFTALTQILIQSQTELIQNEKKAPASYRDCVIICTDIEISLTVICGTFHATKCGIWFEIDAARMWRMDLGTILWTSRSISINYIDLNLVDVIVGIHIGARD